LKERMDTSKNPTKFIAVTTSDSLNNVGVGFSVGVTGAVSFEFADGTNAVMPVCTAGVYYALSFQKIRATGTTATGIIRFN
jgi:hypothetical protein